VPRPPEGYAAVPDAVVGLGMCDGLPVRIEGRRARCNGATRRVLETAGAPAA